MTVWPALWQMRKESRLARRWHSGSGARGSAEPGPLELRTWNALSAKPAAVHRPVAFSPPLLWLSPDRVAEAWRPPAAAVASGILAVFPAAFRHMF